MPTSAEIKTKDANGAFKVRKVILVLEKRWKRNLSVRFASDILISIRGEKINL